MQWTKSVLRRLPKLACLLVGVAAFAPSVFADTIHVVGMNFAIPNGQISAVVHQKEGFLATVYDPRPPQTVGLKAYPAGNPNEADIDIYTVTYDQYGTPTLYYETSITANGAGFTYFEVGGEQYGIRITGIAQVETAAHDNCCVTCNNWKVCGCKVTHSCGSCCVDPCCT